MEVNLKNMTSYAGESLSHMPLLNYSFFARFTREILKNTHFSKMEKKKAPKIAKVVR